MIQDSGMRREFDTGAVRDIQEGKGRCDLLPLYEVGELLHDAVLANLGNYQRYHAVGYLYDAIRTFISLKKHEDTDTAVYPTNNSAYSAMLDVARHFEEGAKKYGERNWEKGIPTHCFLDSAVRHYLKFQRGDHDEPHNVAFLWNILCLIWTLDNRKEMDDIPLLKKEQRICNEGRLDNDNT